jgi:hypothetical protein
LNHLLERLSFRTVAACVCPIDLCVVLQETVA